MRTFKFFSTANNTQFVALSVATLLLIQQFADAQRSGGGSSGGGGGGYSGGGGGGYSGGGGGYSSGGYYYRSGSGGSGGSCDSECGKALGIGFGAAIGGIIFLCLVAAACCNRNKIMDWLRSCDFVTVLLWNRSW